MHSIYVIGAANRDVHARADNEMPVLADSHRGIISEHDGGVARNIAEALSRLNIRTSLLTGLGDDQTSQAMLSRLHDLRVDTSDVVISKGMRPDTYISIHDQDGDMVTAINQMLLVNSVTPDVVRNVSDKVAKSDYIVCDCNLTRETLNYIISHMPNAKIVIDGVSIAKVQKIKQNLRKISLIKVSTVEAAALCDVPSNTNVRVLITELQKLTDAQIILSDGEKGFYITEGNTAHFFDAPPLSSETVTGAGDCLLAGFLFGKVNGKDVHRSALYALRAAQLSCLSFSAVNPQITVCTLLAAEKNK